MPILPYNHDISISIQLYNHITCISNTTQPYNHDVSLFQNNHITCISISIQPYNMISLFQYNHTRGISISKDISKVCHNCLTRIRQNLVTM